MKKNTAYNFIFTLVLLISGCFFILSSGCKNNPEAPAATSTFTRTPVNTFTPTRTATETETSTCTPTFTATPTFTVTNTATNTPPVIHVDDFEDGDLYPLIPDSDQWFLYGSGHASCPPTKLKRGVVAGLSTGGSYSLSVSGTVCASLDGGGYYYQVMGVATLLDSPGYTNGIDFTQFDNIAFLSEYNEMISPSSGTMYGMVQVKCGTTYQVAQAVFTLNSSAADQSVNITDFTRLGGGDVNQVLSNVVEIIFTARIESPVQYDYCHFELVVDNIRLNR